MKFTLKNAPKWFDSRDSIDKWFEGFRKELREIINSGNIENGSLDPMDILEEILGE